MDQQLLLEQFAILRRVLLTILFHSIDPESSDDYIRKQMKIATATDEEIDELYGN